MVEETEGASGVIFAYLVTAVGAHSHSTRQHSTAKYHNAQVPKQFVSDGMCNKRAWLKQHEKLGTPVQRACTYSQVGRLWFPHAGPYCNGVLYPERRSLHTSTKADHLRNGPLWLLLALLFGDCMAPVHAMQHVSVAILPALQVLPLRQSFCSLPCTEAWSASVWEPQAPSLVCLLCQC
jgi:hypothetical protein